MPMIKVPIVLPRIGSLTEVNALLAKHLPIDFEQAGFFRFGAVPLSL